MRAAGGIPSPTPSATIRLVNGPNAWSGRVEVLYDGVWGTVCDDYWDRADATVVCKQLGLPTAYATAYGNALYGSNTMLRIVMDNVACRGTESTLRSCTHVGPAYHDCTHAEDAGVSCPSMPPTATIRLVNGGSISRGRVEVYTGGRWGTVCDDYFGAAEARVICRSLGLPWSTATAVGVAYFGQNTALPIVMDDVNCAGTESSLLSCPFITAHDCSHCEDAGVICSGSTLSGGSVATSQKDESLPEQADDFSGKAGQGNNGNGNGGGQMPRSS